MQDTDFIECAVCGHLLPVEEFYFARSSPGSTRRDTTCKVCTIARVKKYQDERKKAMA